MASWGKYRKLLSDSTGSDPSGTLTTLASATSPGGETIPSSQTHVNHPGIPMVTHYFSTLSALSLSTLIIAILVPSGIPVVSASQCWAGAVYCFVCAESTNNGSRRKGGRRESAHLKPSCHLGY